MKPTFPRFLALWLAAVALPAAPAQAEPSMSDARVTLVGTLSNMEVIEGKLVLTISGTMTSKSVEGGKGDVWNFSAKVKEVKVTLPSAKAAYWFLDHPGDVRTLDTPEKLKDAQEKLKGHDVHILLHEPAIRWTDNRITDVEGTFMDLSEP